MFIHFCCLCPLGLATKLNLNISKVVYWVSWRSDKENHNTRYLIPVHLPKDKVFSLIVFAMMI